MSAPLPPNQRGEPSLAKQTVWYFFSRSIAGFLSFASILIYTRLLPPELYGRYALTISAVGFLNTVFFQWLRLSFGRFLPAYSADLKILKENVLGLFLVSAACAFLVSICTFLVSLNSPWRLFVLLGFVLLLVEAWYELNLMQLVYYVQPIKYGLAGTIRAGLGLVLGSGFILLGLGSIGPLLGLSVALLLLGCIFYKQEWQKLKPVIAKQLCSELLRYGLPLTATFLLGFVINSSDRFLIAWFLGERQAGVYASSYDLAQQPLTLLMTAVNLVAYPLAVWALEKEGLQSAKKQLRFNAVLLFGIALPATLGMILIAPNISLALGKSFREDGMKVLPWITVATFLAGMKAYYFDLAFQLGRRTLDQLWISLIAALTNFSLNLLWIPKSGLLGAAYATVVAYGAALLLSVARGKIVFSLPIPFLDWVKIIGGSSLMALALWQVVDWRGWIALLGQIALGFGTFVFAALVLNVCGVREAVKNCLKYTRKT